MLQNHPKAVCVPVVLDAPERLQAPGILASVLPPPPQHVNATPSS